MGRYIVSVSAGIGKFHGIGIEYRYRQVSVNFKVSVSGIGIGYRYRQVSVNFMVSVLGIGKKSPIPTPDTFLYTFILYTLP